MVGRITIVVAMLLAVLIAPYMGIDKGGLNYIQEYTGFVSPGIFAMFLLGLFWKRTTSNAALFATVGGFAFSVLLKFLPGIINLSSLSADGFAGPNAAGVFEIPFLDRMGFVFLFCVLGMWLISVYETRAGVKPASLQFDSNLFRIDGAFMAGTLLVLGILVALYASYW